MPPHILSRHTFTTQLELEDGRIYHSRSEPYLYRAFPDNGYYPVRGNDTLFTIAGKLYRGLDPERACGLWWVIADFQVEPILDSTLQLNPGRRLVYPSSRVIQTEIFAAEREGE